ncbi:MAG: glycoside hydrolase family 3 C-terminal domain-containing protein [Armatimonadota bacterium]
MKKSRIEECKKRAEELVSKMTLEEKISQMVHSSPAIERLGIHEYNWWNECLHGVARAGIATVFPQAIGLAATWNVDLHFKIATAISDEARAKHHEALRNNDRGKYKGLDFWSPNINIFRDPRWGRGQETYGEDPYLTSRFGVAFVKGLQGDDENYLKTVATPKHYAVHSGPESHRHAFDAVASLKDMWETYLPAFRACVIEAQAESIMSAYNRTNGEPCTASKTLLIDILRNMWDFDGYVVSDCDAVCDIHLNHKYTKTPQESAALAVKNGCELNCGKTYASLLVAVQEGLITEEEITKACIKLFTAKYKLGMFDPESEVPFAQIPYSINDCEEHRQLALQTARESIVLLKNSNNTLPLSKEIKNIAVIGPNADTWDVLLGNYSGTPSKWVTILEGIKNKLGESCNINYEMGCEIVGNNIEGFDKAIEVAEKSNVVVLCLGLSNKFEGEEGDTSISEAGGDRINIDLPGMQEELMKRIYAVGKPTILVLLTGSPVAINWANDNLDAIICAWYPGEEGGTAVADVLFGDYNPSGRLPVTFVKSIDDLPPFEDYSMENRTYKYIKNEPLYPFGFGLSYTTFEYSNLDVSGTTIKIGETLEFKVDVKNNNIYDGDEVVQVYIKDIEASVKVPHKKLIAFEKVSLPKGAKKRIQFKITPNDMALIDNSGREILEPGMFRISVGGSQGDARSIQLGASDVIKFDFKVEGENPLLL